MAVENHNFDDIDKPIWLQGVTRKRITMSRNCWVGTKVCILDGVMIGDECIIVAGAVVNRDVLVFSIVNEVPEHILKKRTKG